MSKRYYLFNQMAGPLFRELAFALADGSADGAVLYTGHPDTLELGSRIGSLRIVAMPGYDRSTKWRRLRSWLSYTWRALGALARMPRSGIAVVVSNPPTMGPVLLLARMLGRRYFVLVYDLHPDTAIAMGVLRNKSLVARLWRWVNRRVWNASEGVITIGHRMADRLSTQFDPGRTALGRVAVVPVWVDTDQIAPLPRAANPVAADLGLGDRTVVLYSGNMGYSHDIDSILQAAQMLRDRDDIAFVLIGEGAKWQDAHDFKTAHKLSNLYVLPFQPEAMLPYTLSMADLALVALDKGAEGLMIPSKTYYYMAAGAAILAICQGQSELTDTIEAAECGVQLEPGQPERLAEAIIDLAANRPRLEAMTTAARAYCVAHHDRAHCTADFADLLDDKVPAVPET